MALKIDVKQKVTTVLPLKPIFVEGEPLFNGFTPSVLIEVSLRSELHEAGEYTGLEVPVLNFVYSNYKLKESDPERRLIISIKPPFTKKKEGEDLVPMEESVIDSILTENWKKIKHVLDNLFNSPNFKNIEDISAADQKKYFSLPTSELEAAPRLEKYKEFYKYISDFVNTNKMLEHPKNKAGYPCYLKLITQTRKGNKGNYQVYDVPNYLGSGFMGQIRWDAKGKLLPPAELEFKPSESIIISNSLSSSNPLVDSSIPTPSASASQVLSGLGLDL